MPLNSFAPKVCAPVTSLRLVTRGSLPETGQNSAIPPLVGWGLFGVAGSFYLCVRKALAFREYEEVSKMAAVCEVCGKGPSWGMSVSHSHVRTKRRWSPNIQRVRAIVKGAPRRLYVCTACIKSGKVVKAGR